MPKRTTGRRKTPPGPRATPATDDTPGGLGAVTYTMGARDVRLLGRAVRQRFPIPDHLRERVPAFFAEVIDSDASPRSKIMAARALIAADSLNMEQEQRDAGGATVNVVVGAMTEDERAARVAELVSRGHQRRPALPDRGRAD